MKLKNLSRILLLATLLMVTTAQTAWAETATIGDIVYDLDKYARTAKVDNNQSYTGTSVTIPATIEYDGVTYRVTAIGDGAFEGTGLTSVSFEAGSQLTTIGKSAFKNCAGLTSVTIPNSVETIGDNAFEGTGLTSVSFETGSQLTTIGYAAFKNCTCLTSFTIPNSVTTIGKEAFKGTGWYDNQPDGLLYLSNWLLTYKGDKPTGTLSISDGTKGIADNAFYKCTGLTSVTIPNSVTTIGDNAFDRCTGLTSINIPSSVTTIGDNAFFYCTGLTSVTIGTRVTSIGNHAFRNCTSVTDVYCYAYPDNLNWFIETNTIFKSDTPKTKFHVFPGESWGSSKFTKLVSAVEFVYDLGSETCPIELTESDGLSLLKSLIFDVGARPIPSYDLGNGLNGLYVTFSRKFDTSTNGDGKASTVCLPFNIPKPDKATVGTFYSFGGVTENNGEYTVTMNEMTAATTTAGTPYLFKPAGGNAVQFSGEYSHESGSIISNGGENTETNGWEFCGTFEKQTWPSGQTRLYGFAAADFEKADGTLLGDVGSFQRFGWGYCDAFRCYLWAPEPSSSTRGTKRGGSALPESMRVILVGADGTQTDIGTLDTRTGEVSLDEWYSLDGRRLNGKPTRKGLYINSGKIVKL